AHRGLKPQIQRYDEQINSTRDFWVWDLSVQPPKCVKIPFILVAVNPGNCIFVEKDAWEKTVSQNDINTVNVYLNEKTPEGSINSGSGIYCNDISTFGEPPDIDKNKKTYFLYYKMGTYMGYGFDGYFNAFDQIPDDVAYSQYKQHSNESDILYMNCAKNDISEDYMLSVLAHEFQHLIHYRYDPDELNWLNESLSEAAMIINGYYTDTEHVKKYTQMPEYPLVASGRISYGACLLFGTYIYERFGEMFLRKLVENKDKSIESFSTTFKALNINMDFRTLMKMWASQNLLHPLAMSMEIDSDYKYRLIDFQKFKINHHFSGQDTEYTGTIKPFAVQYISVDPDLAPFKVAVSESIKNGTQVSRALDVADTNETDIKKGDVHIVNNLSDLDREAIKEVLISEKIAKKTAENSVSVQFAGISRKEKFIHVADMTYSSPDQGKWDEIYLIVINFHNEAVECKISLQK
ncbi:MAG: hypothetical protein HQM10_25585, partial [Candidatus Riflebacteria bacterium]|nr:hypothetical protein [Candidatus Riflebacteria bacterium]